MYYYSQRATHVAILVGVGGTGGNLAPMLARFLPAQWKIVLVDGDRVSESNLTRQPYQSFDVGINKAIALSAKLSSATSANVSYLGEYLSSTDQLDKLITKDTTEVMLFGCVDNHPARIIMEKWFKKISARKVERLQRQLYIDSANELDSGELVISKDGKKLRSYYYPKIVDDKSGNPLDLSCEDLFSQGNLQQYSTNLMAATALCKLVDDFLQSKPLPKQIFFNTSVWGMKSI